MKPEFSQKTTWLSLVGWVAVAAVAVIALKFSAGSPKVEEVNIINPARVNVTNPVPAAEEALTFASEAAPMPPHPADNPEGIEEPSGHDAPEMPGI
jgi:hypothetical protein